MENIHKMSAKRKFGGWFCGVTTRAFLREAIIVFVFAAPFLLATNSLSQSYTNWPATDPEWNQLTNHIGWCYRSILEHNSVLPDSEKISTDGLEPSYVYPYRDYLKFAQAIDALAPHFVCQTNECNGDNFKAYFTTRASDGEYPKVFPYWTAESLHSFTFGNTNWTSEFALHSWMSVTNRTIQLEVQNALTNLYLSCRLSSELTNEVERSGGSAEHFYFSSDNESSFAYTLNQSLDTFFSAQNDDWDKPYKNKNYSPFPLFYVGAGLEGYISGIYRVLPDNRLEVSYFRNLWGVRRYSQPVLHLENSIVIPCAASWYFSIDLTKFGLNDAANGWGVGTDAPVMTYVENLAPSSQFVRIGGFPFFDSTKDINPVNIEPEISAWMNPWGTNCTPVCESHVEDEIETQSLWLLKWKVSGGMNFSPPALSVYPNVVEHPDTDIDDILVTQLDIDSLGTDTGVIGFTMTDEAPCVILPLGTQWAWCAEPRVHAYLTQGAFHYLPYQYISTTDDQDGFSTAFSLNTRIEESGVQIDGNNHTKLVEVVRPRGNVVQFSFDWTGSGFNVRGYPTGVNSKRSYVLVDLTPENDMDKKYELRFDSGVVHEFDYEDGFLRCVRTPNGLSSPINYWSSDFRDNASRYFRGNDFLSSVEDGCPIGATGPKYSTSIGWSRGQVSNITYKTISTPQVEISVDISTLADGQISKMEKSLFSETSAFLSEHENGKFSDTVTYGSGIVAKRTSTNSAGLERDVLLAITDPDLGNSTTTLHINADDRLERIERASDNGPSVTSITYVNSASPRFATNGLLSTSRIQSIVHPDGAGELFDYTTEEGWLSKSEMSLGYGAKRLYRYGYLDNGNGCPANPTNLIERPRKKELLFGSQEKLIGRQLLAHDVYVSSNFIEIEVCADAWASWGATGNLFFALERESGLSKKGLISKIISPDGTIDISPQPCEYRSLRYSSQYLWNGPYISSVITKDGIVTNCVVKENSTTIAKMSSQTDSLGRITRTDFLDGTHVEYGNYCLYGPQTVIDVDGSIQTIAYYANGLIHSVVDGSTGISTSYEYDPLGYAKKITRTAGTESESESFRHDALGRLRYYKDICGAETTIEYTNDENGIHKVTTLPTGGNLEEDFYYDGERRRIGGSAAVQKLVFERGVDEEGYYVKTINAEKPSEFTIVHDSFLGVSSKIKQSGTQNAVSLYYDDKARFVGATDECGISSLLSYNTANQPEFLGDDPCGTGVPDLDGDGKLFRNTREVNANGISRELLTYPAAGSSDAATVAGVNVSLDSLSGTYSLYGRQGSFNQSLPIANGTYTSSDVRPDGSTALITYEHWRLKSSEIKDENNTTVESTAYEYTPLGYLDEVKSSRNGDTVKTEYSRDAKGRVDAITVAGKTTHIVYEGISRRISQIIRPNGNAVTYEYYDNGLLASEDDDEGYDSSYTYDAMGRCTDQVVHGDNNATLHFEWEYDQQTGQLTRKKINSVTIESYNYRDNGQIASGRDALNNQFTPIYNTLGDQTGLTCTSPDNLIVNYTLDRLGRCTSASSTKLVGHTCNRTLDDLMLSDQVLGSGIVQNALFAYGYDNRGRRNAIQFSLAGQPVFGASILNDGASRVSDIDATGGISAHYDYSSGASLATNLVLSTTGGVEVVRAVAWDYGDLLPLDIAYRVNGSPIASFAYSYVTNDNRIGRVTAEDGSWWDYTYDSFGKLKSASRHFSDGTNYPGRLFAYAYDRFGNTIQAGPAPDGATPRYTFKASGVYNVYTNRQWGSKIDISGTVATNANVVMNNVLASRHRNWYNVTIPVSNLTGAVVQPLYAYAGIANYNAGIDLVTAKTATVSVAKAQETLIYNAKGEPRSDSRFRYAFNTFGWLTAVTNLTISPAVSLLFGYDTDGRRIKKTVSERNGTVWAQRKVHQFYYDGWNLVAETVTDKTVTPESTTLRLYTWGLDMAGQRGGRLGQSAGGIGGLLAITEIVGSITNVYYPVSDHIGSIRSLVDAKTGAVVAEYEYDPYGVLLGEAGEKADVCPFRFSGKYYDPETQLLYFGYRYYNPASTKWLTVDPLQERGGLNFTAYCGGDPVNQADPLGLYWQRNANGKWEWVSGSSSIFEDMVSPGIDTIAQIGQAVPDVVDMIWNQPFRMLGESSDPIPVSTGDGFVSLAWNNVAGAGNLAWNHGAAPFLGGFEYHPMRDTSAGSQMAGEALFGNDISFQNRTLMLGLGAMTMAGGALPPTPGGGLKKTASEASLCRLRTASVYSARTSSDVTQSVLKNIDPKRFSSNSRFGKALYLAAKDETAVAEVAFHGGTASHMIRYQMDFSKAKVLDLSQPNVVRIWGSPRGNNYAQTQEIARKARASGYNVIKYPSLRGDGFNFAVFDCFDEILSPRMVVPVQ